MSLEQGMSRDEKEKLLNQKMEGIRRKNEELRRRHQEIEADKKNADKLSSTVTMDAVKPYVMKVPRARPEKSDKTREVQDQPPPPRPADIMPARQRLAESDGPPPDPSYRFLSDPDRDGLGGGRDNRKEQRGRGGKGRGKYGGRGSGAGAWEGPVADGGEGTSERGGRGRGTRGGYNLSKGEDDIPDMTDEDFRGQGRGSNRGRGRGRNSNRFDGEQGPEFGGRGRGRAKENENYQTGDAISPSANKEGGGKGRFSFASRDIRYYPDDDNDFGNERHGRGRSRGNHGQHSLENYDGNRRLRERGRGRGGFEHRGRGRGLGQYHEYERWKAEREAIDEARVTRGRTNDGTWRREWDNDKLEQGEMDESEPFYDPRYPRSKDEGIKLGDFVTMPSCDDKTSSQPQAGYHRGQQGDPRPLGNRGSQGNYRNQGSSIDPEINGKFVRVGSGRMVKSAMQTCQNEADEVKRWGGDKQHHRGRGSGRKNQRGRGSGQGHGRANNINDETSPNTWKRSAGGDLESAPISSLNESSQSHLEASPVSNFISSVHCPKKYNKVQESSNPPGQVTNLTPSDIPADDSSWTAATSGNKSLNTSGFSQEGICLRDDQNDEDAPVEEHHLDEQCVSSELNASQEETKEHIDTNPSEGEIEKHIDTNPSEDEIEKYIDTKNYEDQEGECDQNVEDFEERKDTEKTCDPDVLTACSMSDDQKVSETESEILVVSNIEKPVCSEQKKEENIECMKEALDEIENEKDAVAVDCVKLDHASPVENKQDNDKIEFPKAHSEENNMSESETITENKMNALEDPDTQEAGDMDTTEDKSECGILEVSQEENTLKAIALNSQKILKEKASHEKMPEISLTPPSPTKTEELVPNIEWK